MMEQLSLDEFGTMLSVQEIYDALDEYVENLNDQDTEGHVWVAHFRNFIADLEIRKLTQQSKNDPDDPFSIEIKNPIP